MDKEKLASIRTSLSGDDIARTRSEAAAHAARRSEDGFGVDLMSGAAAHHFQLTSPQTMEPSGHPPPAALEVIVVYLSILVDI